MKFIKLKEEKRFEYLLIVFAVFICVMIGTIVHENIQRGKTSAVESTDILPGEVDISNGLLSAIEEQEDIVNVSSIYGNIVYPSVFSDIIIIEPKIEDGYGSLKFHGRLEHGTYLLYELEFTDDSSDAVGIVADDQGKEYYIHLKLAELPENLTESDANTFYAVQETVNDVLASLMQ